MHDFNRDPLHMAQTQQMAISLLDHLCLALDLTKTQREVAEQRYAAVTKLLATPGSRLATFSPYLFPQGSFLLKTVVKPMANVEYDVDLICLLQQAGFLDARLMFQLVSAELKARYPELVVKDRCCRIEYAGEFHMDVIPARHEGVPDLNRIVVPDRRLNDFVWSCPKLFAAWFEEAAQLTPMFVRSLSADRIVAANAAVIEDLPDYDGMAVEPLRRFVQLFKASRNHFYDRLDCRPPSSIALTTLAAHSYRKAVTGRIYNSMIQVFRFVAEDLHSSIRVTKNSGGHFEFELKNPKDDRENFLDCWKGDHEAYAMFRHWQAQVVEFIDRILVPAESPEGIDATKKRLSAAFGDSAATAAVRGVARQRREMVQQGTAGFVATGALTTTSHAGSTKVPVHTFHGLR
jgi:hypothetical protein